MTLFDLLALMRRHIVIVLVVTLVCTVAGTAYAMTRADEYTATSSVLALTQTDDDSDSLGSYGDLRSGEIIGDNIAAMGELSSTASAVAKSLGRESLGCTVSVDNDTSENVISFTATGDDPETVAEAANGYAAYTTEFVGEQLGVESAVEIAEAEVPEDPSGPNRKLYVIIGFLAGLFLAVCIVVVMDMASRRKED